MKDSIILHIKRNRVIDNKMFQIYNINDKRELPSNIFDISEKKKYLVVPVDYMYNFTDSFNVLLQSFFAEDSLNNLQPIYNIDILNFSPELRKGGFIQQYYANVCISVEEYSNNSPGKKKGIFVYETTIPYKTVKKKTSVAYENLIHKWQKELVNDLNNFSVTPAAVYDIMIPNYKPFDYQYHKNLIGNAVFLAGLDWFGLEGEIFFSAPETGYPFIRNTGTVRYVNTDNYESLLFGKNNENFFWRFNNKMLFEMQSKILIGMNKWKDIDIKEHGLEEIIQICFSLSEQIQLNSLDKKGIIFSLGLLEDVFYIYNRLDYRLGIKASIGFKL